MTLSVVQPNRLDYTKVWDFSASTLRGPLPLISSDVATKEYVDNFIPAVEWGSITGSLVNQVDLITALGNKYDTSNPSGYISDLSTFTTTDLAEGTNLYYTDARARAGVAGMGLNSFTNNSGFISDLSDFTTDNLVEGITNLYDRTVALTEGENITITAANAYVITANAIYWRGATTLGSGVRFSDVTKIIVEFWAQFSDVAAATANGNFAFGLTSDPPSLYDFDDASYRDASFSVDTSGNFYGHTANGGGGANHTETAITGITLTDNNLYRIETTTTDVKFYVNGVLKATNTTNLPGADVVKFGFGLQEQAAATAGVGFTAPNFAIDF